MTTLYTKSLRISRRTRLENLTNIDRLVFNVLVLKHTSENYTLLTLVAKRMSRELKGSDLSLSHNHDTRKLELEIKLPREFWKTYSTRGEVERMFKSLAQVYKSQLDPFFK